jgi:hypothetical protein
VHPTIGGWTRDELVAALGCWRAKGTDIKRVWSSGRWDEAAQRMTGKWTPEPSKVELAKALWPTLLRKIQLAMVTENAPVPPSRGRLPLDMDRDSFRFLPEARCHWERDQR